MSCPDNLDHYKDLSSSCSYQQINSEFGKLLCDSRNLGNFVEGVGVAQLDVAVAVVHDCCCGRGVGAHVETPPLPPVLVDILARTHIRTLLLQCTRLIDQYSLRCNRAHKIHSSVNRMTVQLQALGRESKNSQTLSDMNQPQNTDK